MRRTGIDLSPARCIIVDAEMPRGFRKDRDQRPLRVHNYARLFVGCPQELATELRGLAARRGFPKKACVNLWGVASSHQYLLLPGIRRTDVDAVARLRAAATMGLDQRDAAIATVLGQTRQQSGKPEQHQSKTEVAFFAAALQDIQSQLRPIVEAGFTIDAVTTPCGALWSQARLRRPSVTGQVRAFVALGAHLSALAIFANGFFLYGKDLSWGYAGSAEAPEQAVYRDDLAARLALELRRSFLYVKQFWEDDVSQLLLCGDMREIRSLTAPLIDRLDIEVETLDTLDGIDPLKLPEPADRFSEQVAAFRLASGIAVEPVPVNLLATHDKPAEVNDTRRLLIAMGSAAAVAFAALAYTRGDVEVLRTPAPPGSAPLARRPDGPTDRPSSIVDRPSSIVHGSSSTGDGPTSTDRRATGRDSGSAPPDQRQSTIADRRSMADDSRPSSTDRRRSPVADRRSTTADRPSGPDPIVSSILYSESRQVALVDGRIVKPGDHVGHLVIGAIDRDGVVVITPAGFRKRIGLDRPAIGFARQ